MGVSSLKALNYRFASPLRYEMVDENVRFNLNKEQTHIIRGRVWEGVRIGMFHQVMVIDGIHYFNPPPKTPSQFDDEDNNFPERETS